MAKKILIILVCLMILGAGLLLLLTQKPLPQKVTYGLSFNTPYARELGLDWKAVYIALLDELKVRHLRLAAHWDMVEPQDDVFNWTELDFELAEAKKRNADVIFAVGRRLPRWPECHEPEWAESLSWEDQKAEIREYIQAVVTRYKDDPTIIYWQVENEPYLEIFATEHCGQLDEDFLREEIALVKSLDATRPVLITDSGNLGTWIGAYRNGDAFGTSVYVYFWNPELGQFKTVLPPWFYRAKEGFVKLLFGEKKTFLIELSAEPWLLEPVVNASLEDQYDRMNVEKFNEILEYAKNTRYDTQYLWGAEWWYWLRTKGDDSMWNRGKEVFKP